MYKFQLDVQNHMWASFYCVTVSVNSLWAWISLNSHVVSLIAKERAALALQLRQMQYSFLNSVTIEGPCLHLYTIYT